MSQADDLRCLLVRELEGFRREIALFPSDELLWRGAPGVTNPAGNLALHVAGNLQHFVGASLGGTRYARNRDAEFSTRSGTRAQVDLELQAAIVAVTTTLAGLDDADLQRPMPDAPNAMVTRTGMFLLHLVAHTAFHLGQAGYLRRLLTGDATSADPVPLHALVDRDGR
jgi:uncharacterized damage-inducible protein DinB